MDCIKNFTPTKLQVWFRKMNISLFSLQVLDLFITWLKKYIQILLHNNNNIDTLYNKRMDCLTFKFLKKLIPQPGSICVGVLLGGSSVLGSRCWISVDDVKWALYRVALTNWPRLNEMWFNTAKCKMGNRRVNNRLWEEDLEVELSK